jgi:hypothetical protein
VNRPLGIDQRFTFGDAATSIQRLPSRWSSRAKSPWHCRVMYSIGGRGSVAASPKVKMITGQADWSLDFDIGMNFMEWHAPVPLAKDMGIFRWTLSPTFSGVTVVRSRPHLS